jgi:DnaJ domain
MRANASAYAALGLDPDADPADIDRAYKRLIKRYHPDREGGDALRASEINRAYRELRGRPAPEEALEFHEAEPSAGTGRGWVRAAMVLIIGVATLIVATGPVTALIRQLSPAPSRVSARLPGVATASDVMDQPIARTAVNEGVREALRIVGSRNDAALLDASRDCHRALRLQPSVTQLDRCAAFDDAVLDLQNRDPMWDRGPFSQIAVTGRQWSAASALSNDYLAVDGRLDRIRLLVELSLAPREPPRPAAESTD